MTFIRMHAMQAWTKLSVTAPIKVGTTVRSESRCALRLQYVDLVVSIEVAVEVNFSENCSCTK
jgi:hypothetical protein